MTEFLSKVCKYPIHLDSLPGLYARVGPENKRGWSIKINQRFSTFTI